MLKILASTVLIVTLLGSVGSATYAVFSDTSSILGNTVSTALVDIDAHGEANAQTAKKPVIATGLVPNQWSSWFRGVVFNKADSTNVRVYMYLSNFVGECGKTNLKVTTGFAGNDTSEKTLQVIYEGPVAGLAGNANRRELTGYVFVAPNWLPANNSLVIQQQAQLDGTADNSFQGTTCTWDEVFVAETP